MFLTTYPDTFLYTRSDAIQCQIVSGDYHSEWQCYLQQFVLVTVVLVEVAVTNFVDSYLDSLGHFAAGICVKTMQFWIL